jgi:transcriptional regulator with XRE-family HTH domain
VYAANRRDFLMGRRRRERPQRLAEKLRQVRERLGLSQAEMIRAMGLNDRLTKSEISAFERGTHEPSLLVLLAYCEAANIYLEALVKDTVNLPMRLPAAKKYEGISKLGSK